MAGVKDTALAIAKPVLERAAAAAVEDEARRMNEEHERLRYRNERAAYLLEHSPLSQWFPDATWDIIDFTGVGTSLQYQSDGSDIIVRSNDGVLFALGMNFRDAEWGGSADIKVHLVHLHHPTGYYASDGPYYTGPQVKSVLDCGKVLARGGE